MLRRFTVSAGRARAELRQFLVLYDFLWASSAELRQYLVRGAFWRASSIDCWQFFILIVFRRASTGGLLLRQCPVPGACLRAGFAELRQLLVLIVIFCWVVSGRSLSPVFLFELACVFCLLVESLAFMCVLLINSERCACDWCITSEV